MSEKPGDGWNEWSIHVISQLEEIPKLRDEIVKLREDFTTDRLTQHTGLATLKTEVNLNAGKWAAIIAAIISAMAALLAEILKG